MKVPRGRKNTQAYLTSEVVSSIYGDFILRDCRGSAHADECPQWDTMYMQQLKTRLYEHIFVFYFIILVVLRERSHFTPTRGHVAMSGPHFCGLGWVWGAAPPPTSHGTATHHPHPLQQRRTQPQISIVLKLRSPN